MNKNPEPKSAHDHQKIFFKGDVEFDASEDPISERRFAPVTIGGRSYGGITIREWYAGLAMQALAGCEKPDGDYAESLKTVAEIAVEMADALIYELAKPIPSRQQTTETEIGGA